MPSRLTDVLINRIAFVRAGDNPKAEVLLWKAAKANPTSAETSVSAPISGGSRTRKAPTTKKEADGEHPASDYAYVPDATKPSTWKLRIDTATNASGAAAALGPGGFRGNQASIPAADLAAVKAKVRAAWKKFYPDKKDSEMPAGIAKARSFTPSRLARIRESYASLGDLIEEVTGGREEDHVNEPEFTLPDDTPDEVAKHVAQLKERAEKAEKAEKERDEVKAKSAKVDEPEPDPIEKALADEDTDPVVKDALRTLKERAEKAEARDAATAETLAKKMEDERNAEAVAKVRELRYLALKPEDVGPRLAKLRESDSELADAVEAAMGTVNGIASEAFVAIGRNGDDVAKDGNGPLAQLKAKAKEIAKAEHISEDAAFTKAIATPEGKELHAEYKRQQEEVDAR